MRLIGSDAHTPATRTIALYRDHDTVQRRSDEWAGTARRRGGLEVRLAIGEPWDQELDAPLEQ
jgi:hypothetical protein